MSIKLGDLTLFTVDELSELLDIQEKTIRAYLRDGKLKGRKMAGKWYVTEEALREYFDEPSEDGQEAEKEPVDERDR